MNGKWLALPFVAVLVALSLSPSAGAVPVFSRRYGTSCTTCHTDFPKLNGFGKAFKEAGFEVPKDDESFLKTPPVLPGAPAPAMIVSDRMHESEKALFRSRAPTRSTKPVFAGMRRDPLWT
jgi:hypothetical protein